MAEVTSASEYTRLPCEIPPMERQSRVTDIHDMAMVVTVERCYPGEIDGALQRQTESDLPMFQFVHRKYGQALLDFGFAQARGLELGMLIRSVRHCETKPDTCSSCLQVGLGQDFNDGIAALKELALARGLTAEEFEQVAQWAAEAAAAVPDVDTLSEPLGHAFEAGHLV